MTENQWPMDGSYASSPTTQRAPDTRGTMPDPAADTSTLDTITDEAGNTAEQARQSATSVVDTTKAEAANVASEVKANAKDLLSQAKLELSDQAGIQQQKVAAGLRSISEELRSMAEATNDPGVATDLVRQAAERTSSAATWLDDREPGSIVDEVKTFARRRPGAFLLLAAGAGVLAGRLGRSLSDVGDAPARTQSTGVTAPRPGDRATEGYAPAAGNSVPPPPVHLPGPSVTKAAYPDATEVPVNDGGRLASSNERTREAPTAYPADPVYGNPQEGQSWAGGGTNQLQPEENLTEPLTRDRSKGLHAEVPVVRTEPDEAGQRFGTGTDRGGQR
ncbi:hypothetical protein [Arthrobacter sp. MA-N2]|uniref:hypothetical protein n=1 Tax=Arthrobacter sp. MA-N2 TaxID=1101188 RepID=UPI0004B29D23|nr:hypothetical protein [Arthrobacter sp. MA-N2]